MDDPRSLQTQRSRLPVGRPSWNTNPGGASCREARGAGFLRGFAMGRFLESMGCVAVLTACWGSRWSVWAVAARAWASGRVFASRGPSGRLRRRRGQRRGRALDCDDSGCAASPLCKEGTAATRARRHRRCWRHRRRWWTAGMSGAGGAGGTTAHRWGWRHLGHRWRVAAPRALVELVLAEPGLRGQWRLWWHRWLERHRWF